jgi:hypothetical protein
MCVHDLPVGQCDYCSPRARVGRSAAYFDGVEFILITDPTGGEAMVHTLDCQHVISHRDNPWPREPVTAAACRGHGEWLRCRTCLPDFQ